MTAAPLDQRTRCALVLFGLIMYGALYDGSECLLHFAPDHFYATYFRGDRVLARFKGEALNIVPWYEDDPYGIQEGDGKEKHNSPERNRPCRASARQWTRCFWKHWPRPPHPEDREHGEAPVVNVKPTLPVSTQTPTSVPTPVTEVEGGEAPGVDLLSDASVNREEDEGESGDDDDNNSEELPTSTSSPAKPSPTDPTQGSSTSLNHSDIEIMMQVMADCSYDKYLSPTFCGDFLSYSGEFSVPENPEAAILGLEPIPEVEDYLETMATENIIGDNHSHNVQDPTSVTSPQPIGVDVKGTVEPIPESIPVPEVKTPEAPLAPLQPVGPVTLSITPSSSPSTPNPSISRKRKRDAAFTATTSADAFTYVICEEIINSPAQRPTLSHDDMANLSSIFELVSSNDDLVALLRKIPQFNNWVLQVGSQQRWQFRQAQYGNRGVDAEDRPVKFVALWLSRIIC
ncbi:hypothetical protein IWQ60_004975 [Tieghemiomyces parasiticus]|uniref:Uncharacterized protein n=1 Tax=Tieghemiomyces parasiticus TaxID=78921 RepID=A0A9W8DYN3_9FUNG|nr:hypothetical protein IWQ60_004975 [Tieghemiomyces parasiticus]